MSLFDILVGRQQQINSANNSLADYALSRADAVNAQKNKAIADLEANKESLIGHFSQGGVLDTAVATAASIPTTAGDWAASALEMHNDANETDPIKAAQTRLAAKKIRESMNMDSWVGINPDTGERTSSLQRRVLGNAAVLTAQGSAAAVQGVVGLGSLVSGGRAGQLAEEYGFRPKDGIAALEEYLTPEMRAVNKSVEAADGFGATVDEMLANPSSIAAGIVKSAPSMIMGGAAGKALGLVKGVSSGFAGALGEGTIMAGSQAEGIREQTEDGRLTLKQSLLAAGTGVMGAGVGVLGNKLAKALNIADIDEALVTGALAKSPRGVTTRTALGGMVEGGEELLQSSGETIAQNLALNKSYDEGLGDAAAMGLLTGAPMGAMSGFAGGTNDNRKAKAEARVQHDAATQANDPSSYLDPKSSNFSPTDGLKVLLGHAELATTTPETKIENFNKSKQVLQTLEERVAHSETVSAVVGSSPDEVKSFKEIANVLKQQISTLNLDLPAEALTLKNKTAQLAAIEEGLTLTGNILAAKRQAAEVERRTTELDESRKIQDRLSELVRGKVDVEAVAKDLVTVKAPVDPQDQPAVKASQEAAERLINLSMVSTEHLDQSTAISLANDVNNGLSDPQRSYLRQFSEARVEQNKLETPDSVSNTILYGDKKGNLGVKQYRAYIGEALASGDRSGALRYMDMLSTFAADHAQKAQVSAAAVTQAIQKNQSVQVIRDHGVGGTWKINPKTSWIDDHVFMRNMGGFTVHPKSDGSKAVVAAMPTEVSVLNTALASHIAAYQLKFGEAPTGITMPAATNTAQAPSVGAAAAKGAAVVAGASVNPINISTGSVQNTGKSVQVAQTSATPTSVAPTALDNSKAAANPAVESTSSPLAKTVSGKNIAEVESRSNVETQGTSNVETTEAKQGQSQASSQAASTETTRLKDIANTEKDIKRVTKTLKRLNNGRNSMSLWTALKHSMSQGDINDTYRDDAKRYTLLKAGKDKTPSGLDVRVRSGSLDAFLPTGLKAIDIEQDSSLESEAIQHIKDSLNARVYITEETKDLIRIHDNSLTELEQKLSLLEITQEIDYAESEIAQNDQSVDPQAQEDSSQEQAGSTAAPAGTEEAANGSEQDVKDTTPKGVLSLFSKYVKDPFAAVNGKIPTVSEMFKAVNLVAQYFKQSGVSENNLTNRPLVAVKDFLSAWENKAIDIKDYLDLGEANKLSDEQKSALQNMAYSLKSWLPTVQANFKRFTGNVNFKMNDMMQYFYTEEGVVDVDENVKTAIAYAAYHWIADKANAPMYLTNEQINEMHTLDKDTKINSEGVKVLQRMSSYQGTAIAELGKVVAQALGLKLRDDAPLDLMPRIETALGVHALSLLQSKGYVELVNLPAAQVNAYFEEDTDAKYSEFTTYNYVKFVYKNENGKQVHTDDVRSIKDANHGSGDVITKLFGIDVAPSMALTKPSKFVQKTAKDSKQDIPKAQRKAVQDTMNTPHKVIPAMWALTEKLGRAAILTIAGAKDIDSGKFHAVNVPSIDAQNKNLENQFDLASEMLNQTANKDGFEQAFYVMQSVWKNFRAGFSNQSLNLQTSKIHRFMFARPNWTVNIDLNNEALVNEFLISIAMALGVKTDQQRNSKTMEIFMTKLASEPKIMKAIRILQKDHDTAFTTKEIELVQEVAAGAEGMMSLQAMLAFAQYLTAKEGKATSFETTLLVGADGKTNGPMLTLLALGAADFDTLNRGGFYSTEDGQAKHFSEYFEGAGSMDLYQDLGMVVLTTAKTKVTSAEEIQSLHDKKRSKFAKTLSTHEQFAAFQVLTKALDKDGKVTSAMRNLTKTPLTSFFFGSSLGSSVKGMENAFIDGYYTSLEELAQGTRKDKVDLKGFIEATNILIAKGNGEPIDTNLGIEAMLKLALTKSQENALRKSFAVIMGASVKASMNEYFEKFIGRRNDLNKTIQAAYETYAAVYADAYTAELNSLMEAGKIAYREVIKGADKGKKIPLHGLTVEQEKVLRLRIANITPVMNTAYSQAEDNIRAGVYMAKTEIDKSKSDIHTNTIYTNNTGISKNGDFGAQSHVRMEKSPGVAGLPYSMHSLDSSIMHTALNDVPETMNVHDEGANGVDKIGGENGVANALNKATIKNLLEYSPAREALAMMERLVVGLADRIEQGTSSKSVAKAMLTKWQEVINRNVPDDEAVSIDNVGMEMLRRSVENAYKADLERLTNISKMSSVDQYTWEGGQFTVTKEIRDRATFLKDQLSKSASPEFQRAIKALNKAMAEAETSVAVDLSSNIKETPAGKESIPDGVKTPWGLTGKPAVASEQDLVELFAANPSMSAKEVLVQLRDRLKASGKNTGYNKFTFALIQKLYSVLPADLNIKYITSAHELQDVMAGPNSASRGWYVSSASKQEIYVLSPEFVNSGLTTETLLHEMLHAALQQVTSNPSAKASALVKELEALRQKAMAFVGKDVKQYPGLDNLHDFIAWGMTNREFQTAVLNKITLKSTTGKNTLVTGMKKFIDLVTGFLFKDATSREQELMSNGLAVLIANVSGLFEESAQNQGKTIAEAVNLSMAAQINGFTTTEIHDALDEGKVTPAFNDHLKGILNSIVDKLHGPASAFKDAIAKGVASTPADVFNEALSTGVAPFTSELQASGFMFNNQTFFVAEQVEATVKALLDGKDNKMAAVREELRKLEAEVRGKLKPQDFFKGDWFQATKDERNQATELYNYLFKKIDGDYLARFAALGLAHEGFNALLKTPTNKAPAVLADRSIEGVLLRLFNKTLEAANGKLTHTKPGQPANEKLAALVKQLVEIENRRKNTLKHPLAGIFAYADQKAIATRKGAKDTVSSILNSGMFMKSRNNTVAAASSLVGVVANNQVKYMFSNIITLRNSVYKEKLGVIASAIAEMNGPSRALLKLLREGKSHLEGTRKDIISYTNASVLENFAEQGKNLTNEQKRSVTAVLLRTGAHVLLNTFDMKELASLVGDAKALDKEIAAHEAKLGALDPVIKSRLILDSKALGYHLVSNRSMIADVKMNAHNIANLYLTVYQGRLTEAKTAEITPIIDSLVSLYAMSYTDSVDRNELSKVLAIENARTDGNGVEFAMLTQQHAEKESLSRLFYDSPVLMAKGYIPEIYNPHTDIKAATAAEGEKLLNLGYKFVSNLSLDPNDPFREQRGLYVLRDGGMLPWLSGLFSFTNMRAKGTQHHGENAPGTQAVLARNAGSGRVTAGQGEAFDPRTDGTDHMTPTLNPDGVAVNYRYMMHASTKDVLLERDSRFDQVLGALNGSVFDKEESSKHNEKAVQLLHDDFKEGFTKKSTVYLRVSETSNDPELREIYKMMPKKTKDAIRAIWGKDEMLIRPENLDIAFGYRKLSLSSRFSKDVADQTVIDKAMIGLVSAIMKTYGRGIKGMSPDEAERYSMSNAVMVRRLETIVQEIIHEAKDIYVVKNVITSLNNIKSNMITLLLYGVNPITGLRDMRIAWVGAEEHQRDSAKLFRLQQQLDTGYVKGDTSEIELEIKRLKEALKNNPVTELIEAGLMPSIVEDVSMEEDPYAYKTAFAKRMKKHTDKMNPKLRAVGRNLAMTKDTKTYQTLSRVVQLSDFVARYALYQNLITREIDPMPKEAAAHKVSEAFINYDVPMHRGLEYMDSVGLFMFTKYFLRVQRVIRDRIKHAPGKLGMLLAAESYLGDLPTILDSSVIVRAGSNPFQTGPFELLSAIPQLPSLFWLPGR